MNTTSSPAKSQNFGRAVATVGAWTAVSRVLGFVRDVAIAAGLGAGPIADAFFIAFRLPNFFRQLFGEGAFNSAFVPIFSQKLSKDGQKSAPDDSSVPDSPPPDSAHAFANQSLMMMGLGLIILTIIGEIWMSGLVSLLARGFQDSLRFELAVQLSRITFPYMLLICLAALYSGVLNSMGKFAAAAATPVLLNLTTIAAAFFPHMFPALNRVLAQYFGLDWQMENIIPNVGYSLAWGILLAGVWQLAWLHRNAAVNGMRLRPMWFFQRKPQRIWPEISPAIKTLWRRMGPGLFGAGIVQINLLIGTQIATFLPVGAVSYLYYADRLNQLPMAIIATAMGTALLPLLSRQLAAGESAAALHTQNRALEMTLALTLPCMVGLLVLAHPIIVLLFERGQFTAVASLATSHALMGFVVGLPAYCLLKLFTPAFFARNDTKTPVRVAVVAMVLNIVLNLGLIGLGFGPVGIALGTALAAWVNVGMLVMILRRRGFFSLDEQAGRRLPRLVVAALLQLGFLAVILEGTEKFIAKLPYADSLLFRIIELGGLMSIGAGLFFGFAVWLGALNLTQINAAMAMIKRKLGSKKHG
ncbi:MAG: murein biosynthesis integral membrane protein MurJ [Candidatus Symbiobacter sp.]|nr:murein biosynthesis integral membrane protein MurJ [Candidatus Symbiobacter sp.]